MHQRHTHTLLFHQPNIMLSLMKLHGDHMHCGYSGYSCFRQETRRNPSSKLEILTKVRDTLFFLVGDCYFVNTKMD